MPITPSVNTAPTPVGAVAQDDTHLRKLREKHDDSRALTPSELYRALNDALDEGYDLFDLSNREARFALILMGGLNAALVIAASQTSLGAKLSPVERQIEGAIIGIYVVFALGFVLQAVQALRPGQFRPKRARAGAAGRQALRPGQFRPKMGNWSRDRRDFPRGVRYFEDVVNRNTEEHWNAWTKVTVRQLNAELAVQVHSLSLKNDARKKAVRALYNNLRIMTIVLSLILVLFIVFTLT